MSSISNYIISLLFLLASFSTFAQNADTTQHADTTKLVKPVERYGHQFCLAFDAFQPLMNSLVNYREGYEFKADYYWHNEVYFVAEGGFGNASINYPDLSYTSKNNFVRIGINKSLLNRNSPTDWDMIFVGVRFGMASIQRSAANYVVIDSFYGNTSGSVPAANMTGYWAEITGGMRVELFKGLFAGYTIRGKFRLNESPFTELAPAYIAGYGKGDKNSIFDFNFYFTYAIRWRQYK
jgi:hypothetical protein